jgi:ActR/RegA family two-component response regulator
MLELLTGSMASKPAAQAMSEPTGMDKMPTLSVLVVEDEFLIALSIEDAIEDAGFSHAGSAVDMATALEIVEEDRPTFYTLDMRLANNESGLELARLLFERYGLRPIVVSAYADDVAAADLGFEPLGVVPKPFAPNDIVTALKTADRALRHSS